MVKEVKEKVDGMSKTITFCNTLKDIAALVNWAMTEFATVAFHPPDLRKQEYCILAIYQSPKYNTTKTE